MSKISNDSKYTVMNVGEMILNLTASEVAEHVKSLSPNEHASLCIFRDSDDKIIKDHSIFNKRQ